VSYGLRVGGWRTRLTDSPVYDVNNRVRFPHERSGTISGRACTMKTWVAVANVLPITLRFQSILDQGCPLLSTL